MEDSALEFGALVVGSHVVGELAKRFGTVPTLLGLAVALQYKRKAKR